MRVDLHSTFPLTHENALWVLHNYDWSPHQKRELVALHTLESLFIPLGSEMRKHWYLHNQSFPFPRHYMRRFGLGSPDDIICLIVQNFLCQMKQEPFHLSRFVSECQRMWRSKGRDPVTLQFLPKENQ